MRLPLFGALLGVPLAFLTHTSLANTHESNLTYFGAPRFSIEGVLPVLDIADSYIRSQTDGSAKQIGANGDGRCSASNPCILGSCCNSDGECGYSPEHCSPSHPKTCVSNCDAKAPCGEFSKDGKTNCPLNACCSRLGFCGTSDVFCCDTTVKAGALDAPSCGKGSGSATRRVAYYQSWNSRRRPCDKVLPSQLDLTGLTHLVLSFATIDPSTFKVGLMNPEDDDIYKQFMALPGSVSKWIGIGGYEFTDSGPTQHTWSDMTSSSQNRMAFIESLKEFCSKWGFKGVDIDWEWPGHESRGGRTGDGANQVQLVKEMREALGKDFGIGVVIPAQYDYMKNVDPKGLESHVDMMTMLTYDLHGAWDMTIPGLGPKIKPHTDLKEIDESFKLLWSSNIDSKKVNMGIANYGRGYTVADKSCMHYGCTYSGPSKAGSCTRQDGVLSLCEIHRLMDEKHLTANVIAGGAEVKEISWDDQWVSFDDADTFGKKLELANDRCLGGTALWAIDYATCPGGGDSPPGPGSSAPASQSPVAPPSSVAVPNPVSPSKSAAPLPTTEKVSWAPPASATSASSTWPNAPSPAPPPSSAAASSAAPSNGPSSVPPEPPAPSSAASSKVESSWTPQPSQTESWPAPAPPSSHAPAPSVVSSEKPSDSPSKSPAPSTAASSVGESSWAPPPASTAPGSKSNAPSSAPWSDTPASSAPWSGSPSSAPASAPSSSAPWSAPSSSAPWSAPSSPAASSIPLSSAPWSASASSAAASAPPSSAPWSAQPSSAAPPSSSAGATIIPVPIRSSGTFSAWTPSQASSQAPSSASPWSSSVWSSHSAAPSQSWASSSAVKPSATSAAWSTSNPASAPPASSQPSSVVWSSQPSAPQASGSSPLPSGPGASSSFPMPSAPAPSSPFSMPSGPGAPGASSASGTFSLPVGPSAPRPSSVDLPSALPTASRTSNGQLPPSMPPGSASGPGKPTNAPSFTSSVVASVITSQPVSAPAEHQPHPPMPTYVYCPAICRQHEWCTPWCTKIIACPVPKECTAFNWCWEWWAPCHGVDTPTPPTLPSGPNHPPNVPTLTRPPPPTHTYCPEDCRKHGWCTFWCDHVLTCPAPPECWFHDWCWVWFAICDPPEHPSIGPSSTAAVVLPSPPTTIWCPDECRGHDWCIRWCFNIITCPAPFECLVLGWCRAWFAFCLSDPHMPTPGVVITGSIAPSTTQGTNNPGATQTGSNGPGQSGTNGPGQSGTNGPGGSQTVSATNAPALTSSAGPSGTHSPIIWCPDECKNLEWCKIFCTNPIKDTPPRDCWDFDWCMVWWGWPKTIGYNGRHKDKPEPECQLLGCGCGWMGLDFGPGCPNKLNWFFQIFLEIFGLFPEPCHLFGCKGLCGTIGCDGWCFGKNGCTDCPFPICAKWKPHVGPAPTPLPFPPPRKPGKPDPTDPDPNDPDHPNPPPPGPPEDLVPCQPHEYKTVVDQFVYCGELTDVSSDISVTTFTTWSSTWQSTKASTVTSSLSTCITLMDQTFVGCNLFDVKSTLTSKLKTTHSLSLSSETPGPACTRAPLSLDDDEGNNIPVDWDASSSSFGANITDFRSSATRTSSSASATPSADCGKCWETFDNVCVKQHCSPDQPQWCAYNCFNDMCHAPNFPKQCWVGQECAHKACSDKTQEPPKEDLTLTLTYSSTTATVTMPKSSTFNFDTTSRFSTSFKHGKGTKSTSSSANPTPTNSGDLDRNGQWRVFIHLWMQDKSAKIEWELFDPNKFQAGSYTMMPMNPHGDDSIFTRVESSNRPDKHMMPFNVEVEFLKPTKVDEARVSFEIQKEMKGCDFTGGKQCKPKMITENKLETSAFWIDTCWKQCKDEKDRKVMPSDMNCDDLNENDWFKFGDAWRRDFNCFWKGY